LEGKTRCSFGILSGQLRFAAILGMMKYHTEGAMGQKKVAITIDEALLADVDSLVERELFPNRSRAIQAAIREKLERLEKSRLTMELAKLDPVEERSLSEEGMVLEHDAWPEY
jgi:Arc/MetJ-type ribon-helix-helix transcriptional regulator